MSICVAIVLGIALSAGGTIGLAPAETVEAPDAPAVPGDVPSPSPGDVPAIPGLTGVAALAALALLQRRRDEISPGSGLGLASDPVFVFVPGHGQPPGDRAFESLVELMGVDDDAVRYFDYRWVGGTRDHSATSTHVPIGDAVAALNSYTAGVAAEGHPVYLVGFSKGGATVAQLVADWDRGRWGPSDSVVGAALLDPPIARGVLGRLQSLGRHVGPIPDDGGYDPVRCTFLGLGCVDARAHLGEASGVEVMVIRNPRAAVTSFGDLPEGLRVYDAPDDGPGPWGQMLRNPLRLVGRLSDAHESVLSDPRVAGCIVAEAQTPGSCDLPQRRPTPRLSSLRRPAVRPPSGQAVL